MKKCLGLAAMGVAVLAIGTGSAFGAGSNGNGQQVITASCTTAGDVTVYTSSGQSAWVDDTHWVVQSFSGTFTTTGGETFSFSKTYGNKTGFSGAQECTGSQTEDGGTFTFDVWVAPNPNKG